MTRRDRHVDHVLDWVTPAIITHRLSFKDDTPRVIGKVGLARPRRGPVWHHSVPPTFGRRCITVYREDSLPPFSVLTNDEDREAKAESRIAGTYFVVANPDSFGEYKDETAKRYLRASSSCGHPSARRDSTGTNQTPDSGSVSTANDNGESNDRNVVVLKVFEDDTRKTVSPGGYWASQERPSRASTVSILSPTSHQETLRSSIEDTPLMRMASKDGRDYHLVYYYRNFVHRHLAQVCLSGYQV